MSGFQAFARHVNPSLARFLRMTDRDLRLVRGEGCTLWDDRGRAYDDWYAGFGALSLGHNPPDLLEAARRQLASGEPGLYLEQLNPAAGSLAERLVAAAGLSFDTCLFTTSGAEAVELGLKVAMLATGRTRLAHAAGGFHGLTLGALSAMAPGPYLDPFAAVTVRSTAVPWGDAGALEAALAGRATAAFLMEPIQVEAGLRVASAAYLQEVREICRRHGTLLILDEVQTGLGRTGAAFRFHDLGVSPDLLILAKGLGGGVVPIGAVVMAEGLSHATAGSAAGCDILSGTYSGAALGCAVGFAAVARLTGPPLLACVRERGARLFGSLRDGLRGAPLVDRVTGIGLLGGIVLRQPDHPWLSWEGLGLPEAAGRPSIGPLLADRLHREGILAQVCGHDWSVLRVEPPLVVDDATCDRFAAAVVKGVATLEAAGAPA